MTRRIAILTQLNAVGGLQPQPLACNLKALTSAQRAEHAKRSLLLFSSVRERRQLANGFSFRLDSPGLLPLDEAARWIDLERRCCPFLHFGLDVDPAATWLRLTGPPGVKEFLRAELKLD